MGIRTALRRKDWLAELQGVLAVGAVLAAVAALVAVAWATLGDTVTVTVPAASVDGLDAVREPLRPNASVGDGDVDVVVTDPSAVQRLLSALTRLPSPVLGLVMLGLLWSIVRTARRDGPFAPDLWRRLGRLGVVTLVGGLAVDTIQVVAALLASATVFDDGFAGSYEASWWWLVAGFGFLAVAEVLRRGAAMRVELDHVV